MVSLPRRYTSPRCDYFDARCRARERTIGKKDTRGEGGGREGGQSKSFNGARARAQERERERERERGEERKVIALDGFPELVAQLR